MRSIAPEHFSARGHILVVGGTGRLGRLLRAAWPSADGLQMVWQARRRTNGADIVFDPAADAEGYRRAAAGASVLFNLAGPVADDAAELQTHVDLALAALRAAQAAGVRHVFLASSAAVYGRCDGPAHEDDPLNPATAYGRAKCAMEAEAHDWSDSHGAAAPAITCLRIGNVAGADQLLSGNDTPRALDFLADGRSPRRSYVGPQALVRILVRLLALATAGRPLPFTLNVALEGAVAMDALLAADGRGWQPRKAGPATIPEVRLDVTRLRALVDLPADGSDAAAIVGDLRAVVAKGGRNDRVKTAS